MSAPATPWPDSAPAVDAGHLVDARWDRCFVWGGVLLVPVPILCHLLMQALGVPVAVSEDLVTLLVMVPLGGPHVLATLQRTLFDRRFWRHDRWLAAGAALLLLLVAATAIASAFFAWTLAGRPLMTWLLTFFFFWAGLHVLQQHCYAARCLGERRPVAPGLGSDRVDYLVLLLSLYPVSLFRMSMARPDGASGAAPDALATRLLRELGASGAFVDDYVFRIGRAVPVLPDFLRHPAMWIGVTVAFVAATSVFVVRSWQARRRGEPFGARRRLVAVAAVAGALVPLFPSLDVAFQGINAWHSFQYLGLAVLLHRSGAALGVNAPAPAVAGFLAWRRAVSATLLLVVLILVFAFALQVASDGRFVMFGHDEPPTDERGRLLYRPGSVLLGYYLFGFGFLLVHYLCDTVHFLRRPSVR
ncbi:MAG: hypothetical protein MUC36_20495 [Planctomycetes bacterium]|jgi:hypothetical protein|nr:hypothetical protein [Planctomycetota bacterium]